MSNHAASHTGLTKSLGLIRLSLYGVGTIIGAGIYSVIGPAAGAAGEGIWLSFVLAAIISGFSGLSYAEIASALPGAGAEHNFLRKTFPAFPALAFTVGLFIAVHGAATLATVALTFGNYAQTFLPFTPVVIALVLMAIATAINIAGIGKASFISATLTVLQVSCLIGFALFAIPSGSRGLPDFTAWSDNLAGVLQGAAILFFIYSGYEHMASLSEEAKRPDRDLWRAFMIALVATTVVYLSVILGVLSLVNAGNLAGSQSPLADAARQLGGPFGMIIVTAALVATANAVLSSSISGSRLVFGMARDGDLPKPLARTQGSSRSPWIGALAYLAVACGFAAVGEIEFVASLSSLGVTLVFATINTAVIVLRFTQPNLNRPFRMPSIGNVPPTAVLGVATSLLLAIQYDWAVYATFAGVFLLGAVPYAFIRRRGRQQAGASSATTGDGNRSTD
ncbi:APC family permease [Mesorhizobium australicum]|uniref:Amino acid/polyamine/organocation transporter, APC superfamily n=1 Tax=Mesorhizobium australicum TaxID=536018 RepID=A0A1X7MMR7_9HYPH|nr:APC family permease [Mesorhizobium australicum]SMH26100.1 amino acid/polyamine/organocation transporter, APC superfamily [Mesorhizobium australicum]